jgi:hypothetical protein
MLVIPVLGYIVHLPFTSTIQSPPAEDGGLASWVKEHRDVAAALEVIETEALSR